MPPLRAEGMTDTPTRGCPDIRTPVLEHAPNPPPRLRSRRLLSFVRVFQHAPVGVDVQDLRPLRGRPCGPIPDTDAYPDAPTDPQKKIKTPRKRLTGPAPFRDDLEQGRAGDPGPCRARPRADR